MGTVDLIFFVSFHVVQPSNLVKPQLNYRSMTTESDEAALAGFDTFLVPYQSEVIVISYRTPISAKIKYYTYIHLDLG